MTDQPKISCICRGHSFDHEPATQEDLLCDGCRENCPEELKRGLPLPFSVLPPRARWVTNGQRP